MVRLFVLNHVWHFHSVGPTGSWRREGGWSRERVGEGIWKPAAPR